MESLLPQGVPGEPRDAVDAADQLSDGAAVSSGRPVADLLDSAAEKPARERLFDEVLAGVELVLEADGAAFWREEPDHSLLLTSSRSLSRSMLDALDRTVTTPLQSIMQRWPDSPLVAVPLNDPSNAIAEDIRAICEVESVSSLAGVPCRISEEMLGLMIVIHRSPHAWSVRDLGLATGFAGQLATAMQNAHLYASVRSLASRLAAIHELSLRLAELRDVEAIGEAIVAESDVWSIATRCAYIDSTLRRAFSDPSRHPEGSWASIPLHWKRSPAVTAKRSRAGWPSGTSRSSFRTPPSNDARSSALRSARSRCSSSQCLMATSSRVSWRFQKKASTAMGPTMSRRCRSSAGMRPRPS